MANPVNGTARLFLDYTTGRHEHTVMVRYNQSQPDAQNVAISRLLDFLNAISADLVQTWATVRLRYAAQFSDVTLPVAMPTELQNFVGTGNPALPENQEPRQFNWTGRSPINGTLARVGLYGCDPDTPATFRLGPGETLLAAAATIAVLNTGTTAFVGILNDKPVWRSYVNVNYNSYWETAVRA